MAKQEATNVAHEAKYQVKDLVHQSRQELMDQASRQQSRAAEGLRSIHHELDSMASNSEGSGVGTDLVRQAATRARSLADWLDNRDPGSLLEEVKGYARRKPGTFLAIAAGAGLLAGRLTRSLAAEASDDGASQRASQGQALARPSTPPPAVGTYPTGEGFPTDGAPAPAYTQGAGYTEPPGYLGEQAGYAEQAGYRGQAGYQGQAGYPEEAGYAEQAGYQGQAGYPEAEGVDGATGRHASGLVEPRDRERGELP